MYLHLCHHKKHQIGFLVDNQREVHECHEYHCIDSEGHVCTSIFSDNNMDL